jgi:hypothetical protein
MKTHHAVLALTMAALLCWQILPVDNAPAETRRYATVVDCGITGYMLSQELRIRKLLTSPAGPAGDYSLKQCVLTFPGVLWYNL